MVHARAMLLESCISPYIVQDIPWPSTSDELCLGRSAAVPAPHLAPQHVLLQRRESHGSREIVVRTLGTSPVWVRFAPFTPFVDVPQGESVTLHDRATLSLDASHQFAFTLCTDLGDVHSSCRVRRAAPLSPPVIAHRAAGPPLWQRMLTRSTGMPAALARHVAGFLGWDDESLVRAAIAVAEHDTPRARAEFAAQHQGLGKGTVHPTCTTRSHLPIELRPPRPHAPTSASMADVCGRHWDVMQPQVTYIMRAQVVDWLFSVAARFQASSATLHRSVLYLDTCLAQPARVVPRDQLQLLATAAFRVACKYEGHDHVTSAALATVCEERFGACDVEAMEWEVASAMQWQLGAATGWTWLEQKRGTRAPLLRYLIDQTLLDSNMLSLDVATIARRVVEDTPAATRARLAAFQRTRAYACRGVQQKHAPLPVVPPAMAWEEEEVVLAHKSLAPRERHAQETSVH